MKNNFKNLLDSIFMIEIFSLITISCDNGRVNVESINSKINSILPYITHIGDTLIMKEINLGANRNPKFVLF